MDTRRLFSYVSALVATFGLMAITTSADAAIIIDEDFDASASAPAGWTLTGGAFISTDPQNARSGNNAVWVDNLSGPATAVTPELGIAGATEATLSFYWTTDVHGGAFGRTPFIDYDDGTSGFVNIDDFTVPSSTSSVPAHTFYSITIDTANDGFAFTDASKFRIRGDTSGGSTQAPVIVDDLTVEADVIPEPASLALVGLGGVLMLGRGRRRVS